MSRRPDWLLQQLPVAMVEDDFLSRFVMIFQSIADTELHHVDQLKHVFDPNVAPDEIVRVMGWWIGIEWIDSSLPDELQRSFVNGYSQLLRWRGTCRGLTMLIEMITGAPVTITDSGGVYLEGASIERDPHVVLRAQQTGWVTEADLTRIVRAELPATVTFELFVGSRQLWPQTAALAEATFQGSAARPTWDPPALQWAAPVVANADNGAST
jgi:phage tail-like protein